MQQVGIDIYQSTIPFNMASKFFALIKNTNKEILLSLIKSMN